MADADQVDGRRTDTMMTARRVAAAKYDLNLMKRDVCVWLSETLQLDISPENFMDMLDTGVVVCKLVVLIQEKARALDEAGEEVGCSVPLKTFKFHEGAKKATFQARENTKHFLDWCRGVGVRDDFVFESNGLVEHADEKRVLLCLLEVSRYARKLHIKPPNIISMEQEAVSETESQRREETVKPEDNVAASSDEVSTPIEPAADDSAKLSAETKDPKLSETNEVNEPTHADEAAVSAPETNPPGDDKAVVSPPEANLPPGEGKGVVSDDDEVPHSSFLDRCSYPFLFSFLLLLLLLGGGYYLRKRR